MDFRVAGTSMDDMRVELEVDSQLERTWVDLSDQVGGILASGQRSILFAISMATAVLTIAAATITLLNRPDLWWVSTSLTALGVFILAFVWELGNGSFDAYL